jgi:hypothetical protein
MPLIGIAGLEGCSQWNFMPIYGRHPRKAIYWCRRLGMHESIRPVFAGPFVALMGVRCFWPHKIIGLEGLGINQA